MMTQNDLIFITSQLHFHSTAVKAAEYGSSLRFQVKCMRLTFYSGATTWENRGQA